MVPVGNNKSDRLTFVIPVHNESAIIEPTFARIKQFEALSSLQDVTIILVENGSSDNSRKEVQRVCDLHVGRVDTIRLLGVFEEHAGIGYAYARGIREAFGAGRSTERDWIILTACDLPFGETDLTSFLKMKMDNPACPIFIGSKRHPDSHAHRNILRVIMTEVFCFARTLILKMRIKDTQGSFFVRGDVASILAREVASRDFFFTTELCYRAMKRSLEIIEVPVKLQPELRRSTVRPIRDSWRMIKGLIRIRLL
jgi:glycosyltransferase involved in cell wall biosynthesis